MEFQLILTGLVLWAAAFVARVGADNAKTYAGEEALTGWAWTIAFVGLVAILCGIWWDSF